MAQPNNHGGRFGKGSASTAESQNQRRLAGDAKEGQHELTLAYYRRRRIALVEKHELPTKGPPRQRHITGPTTVDYTGGLFLPGMRRWDGGPASVPVAYDLKGATGRTSYEHDPKLVHQLDYLLEAEAQGHLAFLWLVDDRAGWAWMLHGDHLRTLREWRPVRLCSRKGARDVVESYVPNIAASTVRQTATGWAPGYDWVRVARQVWNIPVPAGTF